MLKTKFFKILSLCGFFGVLSCSNFGDSTSIGKNVVNEVDPSLTDFNSNFISYARDSVATNSWSVVSPVDTLIGSNKGRINAGHYFNHSFRGSITYVLDTYVRDDFDTNDIIDSVTIRFDTLPPTHVDTSSATIQLHRFFNNGSTILTSPDAISPVYPVTMQVNDENVGFFADTIRRTNDSLCRFLTNDLRRNAQSRANKIPIENDTILFGFHITSADSLIHLNAPSIKLHFRRDTTHRTYDIYPSYSNYIAVDTNTAYNSQPVASNLSGRKAVFNLNLTDFWKKMDTVVNGTSFNHILSTELTTHATLVAEGNLKSYNTFAAKYFVSKTRLTDENAIRDSIAKVSAFYKKIVTVDTLKKVASLNLQIEPFLQKYTALKPDTVYLYISGVNSDNILNLTTWEKPSLKAVFTNIK